MNQKEFFILNKFEIDIVFRGNLRNFELYLAIYQKLLVKRNNSLDKFVAVKAFFNLHFNELFSECFLKNEHPKTQRKIWRIRTSREHFAVRIPKEGFSRKRVNFKNQRSESKVQRLPQHFLSITAVLEIKHDEF